MRQTNSWFRLETPIILRYTALALVLILFSTGSVSADITNVKLTVKTDPDTSTNNLAINSNGKVNLSASWEGPDTKPHTCIFKLGTDAIVSIPSSSNNASTNVSASTVGHGDSKAFNCGVIANVPNAPEVPGSGDKTVKVDLVPPTITVKITKGQYCTNIPPNNVVEFTVSSNEPIQAPTFDPPNPGGVAPTTTDTAPATAFKYTMTLTNSTSAGNYIVKAVCRDNTVPAENGNQAAAQDSFNVTTAGPGAPTINSIVGVEAGKHIKSQGFSLTGKITSGMVTVNLFESGNTTAIATASPAGEDWTMSLSNVTEGKHYYSVRGIDALGNQSAASAQFEVQVDLTKPATPKLNKPTSPVSPNVQNITITGTNASDTAAAGVESTPIKVTLYKNSTTTTRALPMTTTADSGGNFTFTVAREDLAEGDNIFYATAEDAAAGPPGNVSDVSNAVNVKLDGTAIGVNQVMIARGTALASQTIPVTGQYFGSGTYALQVNFDKEMDKTVMPSIAVKPAGGAEVVTTSGSWISSFTFIGSVVIPANQGGTYDGQAGIRVFGAKDIAGNVMGEYSRPDAFLVDTTPPTTTMSSMDTIYLSNTNPQVTIQGTCNDEPAANCSGVGYVLIATQPWDGATPISYTKRIYNSGQSTPWDYNLQKSAFPAQGKYKLWVIGADQARPDPNVETLNQAGFRTIVVASASPGIDRICFDDESTDIGNNPTISSAVVKLTAVCTDPGGSGLNFNVPPFVFTLVHNLTSTTITGNYTNNGTNTIYMTFPQLTLNGTYTVTVQPVSNAGDALTPPATRTFVLDTTGPDNVGFDPGYKFTVQDNYPPIAADEVWATNSAEVNFGYTSSTIEVSYNGVVVGNQKFMASSTTLIWDLYGTASHPSDQSGDGRYDVTVVPKDQYGNTGTTRKSYFYLDTQHPVVTQTDPTSLSEWVGLSKTSLDVFLSDAPKDITASGAAIAGDATWQGGPGSGLNVGAATFTLSSEGEVVRGVGITTSSMRVAIPNPQLLNNDTGLATLAIHLEVPDGVQYNGPNIMMVDYPVYMDIKRPQFTFDSTAPKPNGKYCKKSLALRGGVQDRGTSNQLLVTRAGVGFDLTNWESVTCTPALSTKSASYTHTLDISKFSDGSLIIYGTCTDRAGNDSDDGEQSGAASPTGVIIRIDRTPPPAPLLVLPLHDSLHRTRGLSFKWSEVIGADKYLFQVADDSAFNNIINHVGTNASYSDLKGEVISRIASSTQTGAFSVPKDGTYYWRVASIETCEDGYNISAWSVTWRFTVDTIKPKVLEVQPTPSTGNKITTGMVTFTIRFSEKMDATVPLTVSLTSAGGQMMLVEQLTYTDNTWTGTTVIPKDNSPIYDGNAVISISGGKDMAGNQMETDSTHVVVINTGPAFETKIFSNPAHEYDILVVTRSTEALNAPPTCSITQGSGKTPVTMNFLKERYYAGGYLIDKTQSGKAYIDISGTDLQGMTGKGSVEFTVAEVSAESRITLKTPEKDAQFDIGTGTFSAPTALYILSRSILESPSSTSAMAKVASTVKKGIQASVSGDSELTEVLALEDIGPSTLKLSRKIAYSADLKGLSLKVPAEKVALYRYGGGKWNFCGGTIKNGKIVAALPGLGRLALMADTKAPRISSLSPADLEILEDPAPTFQGTISDLGSGFTPEGITLSIDGLLQPGVTLNADGTFSYKVRAALSKGLHKIELTATDRAGNTVSNSFSVTAPGPFAIDELMAYPNPTRGNAIWFNYNLGQRADEISLKIYDTAGTRVAEFQTFDFPALAAGKIKWDLCNDDGRRISNGVYFYKMEATRNGKTHKARGKFAVLR